MSEDITELDVLTVPRYTEPVPTYKSFHTLPVKPSEYILFADGTRFPVVCMVPVPPSLITLRLSE